MLRHVPRHTEEFFRRVPGRYVPKYTELIARGMYRSNAFRAHNVHPPLSRIRVRQLCYVNLRCRPNFFSFRSPLSRVIISGEHSFSRSRTRKSRLYMHIFIDDDEL